MATVTVRAEMPLTWLDKGKTATVESTPLIRGAIKSGMLKLLKDERPAAPKVAAAKATPAKVAKASKKR